MVLPKKRMRRARWKRKSASAGEGWRSLAAVRDGNAPPLGRLLARGSQGYILRRFSLPLAWWLMKASAMGR